MALAGAIISNADGGLAIVSNPHLVEIIFSITPSDSYTTGGDTLDLTALTGAPGLGIPPTAQLPLQVVITGIAGYDYKFVNGTTLANGKLIVRQAAGFTPAGTSANPTVNTVADSSSPTAAVGYLTAALSTPTAQTGLTGVIAGAFTGTPVPAGPLAELPASAYPAGVTGDTIIARASFLRG